MKHNLTRRVLPVAAVAMAVGLALSGCASDDSDATATPSPSMSQDMDALPEGASVTDGNVELTGFWVKESSLDMSAGFGTIQNNANEDDALVGASAPGIPMIELHETVEGVMQQEESFPITAGGTLVLSPGGNHLMFVGLTEPLSVGEDIAITLQFESGATATIAAPVEPFSGDDDHDEGI